MPIVLALAGLAALVLYEQHKAHGGAAPTYGTALVPGAEAYLPPIAAPDAVRIAYANAMYRKNPIEMVQCAQQIMAQYPQFAMLAQQLSASYAQLTNNPIPGIPGGAIAAASAHAAGARSLVGLDLNTIHALAAQNRRRKLRAFVNQQRHHPATLIRAAALSRQT